VLANGILAEAAGIRGRPVPARSVNLALAFCRAGGEVTRGGRVGSFDLTERTVRGTKFYQAQASSLSAARKAANRAIMDRQPDITRFESQFNGRTRSLGRVIVGRPSLLREEMQTMITFAAGT